MNLLEPAAWIVGLTCGLLFFIWIGIRAIRWAKRRSRGTDILGLALGLPAAGMNPVPPPQEFIDDVRADIQIRRNSDAADPKDREQ
jgi:hypothetical protein